MFIKFDVISQFLFCQLFVLLSKHSQRYVFFSIKPYKYESNFLN